MVGAKETVQGDAQAALDHEDALAHLASVDKALQTMDFWQETVTDLERQLKQAKRKLEEATWDVNARIRAMRRAPRPAPTKPNAQANGKR